MAKGAAADDRNLREIQKWFAERAQGQCRPTTEADAFLMLPGTVDRHGAVHVGGQADARDHGDWGVAIGDQWVQLCGGCAPERDRAGQRGEQTAATRTQHAVAVKAFGVVVAHGSTDEEAMPGVSLLELAFLFAVDAIGRRDIGFTEGSIPGAVAISAKQVGRHLPELRAQDCARCSPNSGCCRGSRRR